uniref:Uncharacterized protein n=1 Tax=Rhipicephalus appendiculatus TaxID=34631 RepID=A0A131YHP7_RHIAP
MLCFSIPLTMVIFSIILPIPDNKPPALVVAFPSPEPSQGLAGSKQQQFLKRTNSLLPHTRSRGRHGCTRVDANQVRQYAKAMTQRGEVEQILQKYKSGLRGRSPSPSNLRQGLT